MDTGDTITLIVGIIIVLFVALMANPGYLDSLKHPLQAAVPTVDVSQGPASGTAAPPVPELIPVTQKKIPAELHEQVFRIVYTDKPYTYPRYMIPEHMETFGASEVLPRTGELVPFAFLESSRGGLTEVFSVPYPVWVINSTVVARTHPQYGMFRMVLCYADNGSIIDGEEILNQGTSYRVVQTSGTPVYMIISAENIDSFYIRLETPGNYYAASHPDWALSP